MTEPGVTSLVVHDKLSKLELLRAVARASGRPIVDGGSARARVQLDEHSVAEIEVPKFGEDVQLTIDVSGPSPGAARALLEQLRVLGLTVTELGAPS